ncbi:MAG: two-component regulator propeller domain-containing protein [Saprospiraceae bacterium]
MKYTVASIFIFLLLASILSAQSHYFQQYSVGEGLPQSQVYALHQDQKGYLWLGTQGGGLARFDGTTFVNFTEQDGLTDNYIHAIIEDAEGQLWIGTNRGVSLFDGSGFQQFTPQGNKIHAIQDLAIDQNGRLWAASLSGIYFLDDDRVLQKEKKSNIVFGRLYATLLDSQNRLWMAGEKGIFLFNENTDKWQKAWSDNAEVLDLVETPDGQIWAAAFNYGLVKFDGKNWNLEADTNLPSVRLQCLWPAPNGAVWVGTQTVGVFIYDQITNLKTGEKEPQITSLRTSDGLCNNSIRAITNDRWGNVWLGTSGSGVCKYGGQEFEHLTRQNGLQSDFIYALSNDTSGGLWLSAGDKGVSFFKENNFTHFGRDSGFLNVKCRAIHQDLTGQVWIGTERWGLATFYFTSDSIPERKFVFFDREEHGLAGNYIRDITSNTQYEIWVAATDGGLSQFSYPDSVTGKILIKNYGIQEGLSDPNVHAIHFDKWGRLWVGTRNRGLGTVFKERVEMLGPASKASNIFIRCIAEDDKGNLWIGTDDRGLGVAAIYQDTLPVFSFFGKKEGLASANIYLLQFDEFGQLWAGSDRGVDKIKFDASGNILNIKNYGLAEGFKGVETCQQASVMDAEGSLWFGTVNGLMRHRPQMDTGKVVKPLVHFTSINLFYEPLAKTAFGQFYDKNIGIKKGAVFPYNQNHLGFEFFAPNFPNPEKTFYSWQLIGSEENWSPFSKRNEVSYSNLPSGEYTFQVRAKNEQDIIGEVLKTSFTIQPPFWETWWFRISTGSIFILLIGTLFWLRIRQVRKKAALEKAQLEMQNHLLQLEQKARQLQMNPHFIFNALNSIQSLVARKDFDGSRSYILKFGKLMRAVLDNSRKASIPLEKEIDTLQKYLEMEQFCRDGNFDFSINANDIENDELEIPPMLLQPFVENAILHGVAPLKDRRGMIEINFSEKRNTLQVEIKDNGVGINQSPNSETEKKTKTSAGIAVTRERIKILNGHLEIKNNIKNGTLVHLEIPI